MERVEVVDAGEHPHRKGGPGVYSGGDLKVVLGNLPLTRLHVQTDFFDLGENRDEQLLEARAFHNGQTVSDYVNSRFIRPLNEELGARDGELVCMISRGYANTLLDSQGRRKMYAEMEKMHIGIVGNATRVPSDRVLAHAVLLTDLAQVYEIAHDEEFTGESFIQRSSSPDFTMLLNDNPQMTSRFYSLANEPALSPDPNQTIGIATKPRLEFGFDRKAIMMLQSLKGWEYFGLQKELTDKMIPSDLVMIERDLAEKRLYFSELREHMRRPNEQELRRLVKQGFVRNYHLCDRDIAVEGKDQSNTFNLSDLLTRLHNSYGSI